jgi:hypothetical protein
MNSELRWIISLIPASPFFLLGNEGMCSVTNISALPPFASNSIIEGSITYLAGALGFVVRDKWEFVLFTTLMLCVYD